MYVRTGEQKFLEAAYEAAHFVRTHSRMEGPDAGAFIPKGKADLKYVYPRAHTHSLPADGRRARARRRQNHGEVDSEWLGSVYHGGFWTPRHEGYGLLGVVHGWELTGDPAYWKKARAYADALYQHQKQPPDGRPPDGSFRENWAQYDPSEAKFKGATSAWMMAILLGPMFHYWTLTGDSRIPENGDSNGAIFWTGRAFSRTAQRILCDQLFAGEPGELPSTVNGDMTRHDTEMSYEFAMGIYFSQDPARAGRLSEAIRDALFHRLEQRLQRTSAGFQLGIPSLQPAGLFHAASGRKAITCSPEESFFNPPPRLRLPGACELPPLTGLPSGTATTRAACPITFARSWSAPTTRATPKSRS